jgi:hypothetical protein
MFDFLLSEDLVRRMIKNLQSNGITTPPVDGHTIGMLRAEWGKAVVGAVGVFAHRTRYAIYETEERGIPSASFCFIHDGEFPGEILEYIGGVLVIPPGGSGDLLLRDVAREFIARVQTGVEGLHAQAPVTRLEAHDQTVIVCVRPRDPPFEDPDFVPATGAE